MQADIKNTILGKIVERKQQEIAIKKQQFSLKDMEQLAQQASPVRDFAHALTQRSPAVIAEIKKASPSKGVIRQNFDVASIAQNYQRAGASCLSVLTDVDFFQGQHENVAIARQACDLPALRKDFMIEPYHIIESRALHADCILLIVACLSNMQLQEMASVAFDYNMSVLVEVHDEDEMQRALDLPEHCLIGVNNRNLKTFDVDIQTTIRLQNQLGKRPVITESGIHQREQVELMLAHGIDRFLVGEGLMKQSDEYQAFRELFGEPK
ncbi:MULTISPECIES: indole-3-glycerol phosphate synthase TrpC [unclassified Acinetobacter]|uniref:indole-3-glycerol phosphate synthase TrpC n=1 Tax=unclassified Acinetobacter TaxID=196816 RepID=UPI0035B729D8